MSTLATLRDLAIAKALGPSQGDRGVDVSAAFTDALINEGLHKIERAALWVFSEAETTITLTVGQTESAVPADFGVPLMARNEHTERELLYHDERQQFLCQPDRSADVEVYSSFAGTLRFAPPPKRITDVTVRFYRVWPDLTDDDDEPIFPATWHDILSDYAAAKMTLRLQPVAGRYLPKSAAEPYETAWQSGLEAMLRSDLTRPTFDLVQAEHLQTSIFLGEGIDW